MYALIANESENKEDELIKNIEQKRSKQTPTTTWVGFQIRCLAKDHLGFCSVIALWLGVDFSLLKRKKSTDPSLICCRLSSLVRTKHGGIQFLCVCVCVHCVLHEELAETDIFMLPLWYEKLLTIHRNKKHSEMAFR